MHVLCLFCFLVILKIEPMPFTLSYITFLFLGRVALNSPSWAKTCRPVVSASRSTGIRVMSHCTWLYSFLKI